jgi:hypothetical protein
MSVGTIYAKVKDRLNKGSSSHNQNITERQFVYAFNKMQLHWFDQRIKAEEADKVRQNELQQFIVDFCKTPTNNQKGFYNIDLPEDFFYYKRVTATAKKGNCEGIIYAYPIEESLVNRYLQDEFNTPSFLWQETFFTIGADKLRVYHNNDFSVSEIYLVYYRCPKDIDMKGVTHIDGDGVDVDSELTKTNLEEVIDLTVRLLSGDIMDSGRFQVTTQHINEFN